MNKDTYYFPHDYNARNDTKMQELMRVMGCEGIGIYWCVVEMLYEQGGKLLLSDCKSIAFALHLDMQKILAVINNFNLFERDEKNFWSKSINRRLEHRKNITEIRKNAAVSRWKPKENANAMQMQSKSNAIKGNKIKGKEIKENKIKDSNIISDSLKTILSSDLQSPEDVKVNNDVERINFSRIINSWNQICTAFPKIRFLSEDRKNKIRVRIEEMGGIDKAYDIIDEIFTKMQGNKFLKGDNNHGWKASFDWIFTNGKNWSKVIEGNYEQVQNEKINGTERSPKQRANDYALKLFLDEYSEKGKVDGKVEKPI